MSLSRPPFQPFFAPGSVAVVGASRRHGSIGGELFREHPGRPSSSGLRIRSTPKVDSVAGVKSVCLDRGLFRRRSTLLSSALPEGQILEAARGSTAEGNPGAVRDLRRFRRDRRGG